MRRNKLKVISAALVLIMILGTNQSAIAQSNKNLIDSEKTIIQTNRSDWKNYKTDKIEFPITSDSEKWASFSNHDEMIAACTIPDELLKKMSTEELIDIVLDYPLLGEILAYSSYDQGFEAITENFNGLEELLLRTDNSEVLLDSYCNSNIVEKSNIDCNNQKILENTLDKEGIDKVFEIIDSSAELEEKVSDDMDNLIDIIFLEVALAQEHIIDKLSDSNLNVLSNEAEKKYNEKCNSDTYNGFENILYKEMLKNDTIDKIGAKVQISIYEKEMVGIATSSLSGPTIKTPNGSIVPVEWGTNQLTSTQIINLADWVRSKYPNANIKGDADSSYNCHSYAWYKQSVNHAWMNSPQAYVTDGSYTRLGTSPTAYGQRALWISAPSSAYYEHSGYVTDYRRKVITSKWGAYPLVEHNETYCPYGGTIYYYQ